MRSFRRILRLFAGGVLAALAIAVLLRAQSQEKFHPKNQDSPAGKIKQLDDEASPIVDLTADDSLDASRRLKNSRHDGRRWIRRQLGQPVFEVLTEPQRVVSDLPAHESDLIIEGEAIASAAFLSNDKNNVYSEFSIRVAKVFRGSELSISPGDVVTAERLGGRVRYPDGRVVRYRVVGQGSPANGKTYLFFLSSGDSGTYTILTAYEIAAGTVLALDGARTNRGVGKWSFDRHNNRDYADLISEVAAAIDRPRIKTRRTVSVHETESINTATSNGCLAGGVVRWLCREIAGPTLRQYK